jgi:two-component system, cell cycle sensor histidine kinase and response regulator CckA
MGEESDGALLFSASSPFARDVLCIATIAFLYAGSIQLGLSHAWRPEDVAPIWAGPGILLAAVLLARRSLRPFLVGTLALIELVAGMLAGTSLLVSLACAVAVAGDAVLSAWLLLRFVGGSVAFRKVREVTGFLFLAVVFSSGLMALAAAAAEPVPGFLFWDSWKRWALPAGTGKLLMTPLILCWAPRIAGREGAWSARRALEAIALAIPLGIVSVFVLADQPKFDLFSVSLPCVTFSLLLWAALRFGMCGVTSGLSFAAVIVVVSAAADRLTHPFSYGSQSNGAIVVEVYLLVMAVPSLLLAAVVTEREEAQKALRESEARLSEVEAIAHLGSWEVDMTTGRRTWSDETFRILGMAPQASEATYEAFLEAVHPDDRAAVDAAYRESLRGGNDNYEIEHRVVKTGTGEILHVYEKCEHLRDAGGRITRSVGILQDISGRRRAEKALRRSQQLLKRTFDNLRDALFLIDADAGTITECNPAASEMFGYDVQEMVGRPIAFLHVDDAALTEFRRDLHRAIQEKGFLFLPEFAMRRRDGTVFAAEHTVVPIEEGGGKRLGWVSVVRDITERKRAEEEVRSISRKDEEAIRIAHMGHWEFDLATGLFRFNDPYYVLHGTNAEEAGGYLMTADEFARRYVHPDDSHLVKEAIQQGMAAEDPQFQFQTESRILRSDGEVRTVIVWFRLEKDAQGKTIELHGVNQDITERKRAEEEREKLRGQFIGAQKMEAVGRLAGGVAHDFNNMLGVILGHAEMALMQAELSETARAHLGEIRTAAERSARLTQQLLAFARRQTIAPRVLDLNDAVAGMLKMLQRLMGEDIDLAWAPGRDLWKVKIDPSQLDQILANLCINARDAIVGVGKITIETHNTTFDEVYCASHAGFVPGQFVMLAVSDNGAGMDKDVLEHLFEPFFTTKGIGKGTGLGLATVYGIVKQNDGFINVYSEPGVGTTFKIYVPSSADGLLERGVPAPVESPKGIGERVLLVEDEAAILNLGKLMLEELGYTVLAAGTPDEAIRLAETHSGEIHLLITDVVLPGMDGKELAERLGRASSGIKCLFMSGYTANVIAHRGVLEDGVQFIQKPFSMDELAVKVRCALGRE